MSLLIKSVAAAIASSVDNSVNFLQEGMSFIRIAFVQYSEAASTCRIFEQYLFA